MTLPRPVKQVLVEPPADVAVARAWARLQVSRRVHRQPWGMVLVATAGLGLVVGLAWPRPPPELELPPAVRVVTPPARKSRPPAVQPERGAAERSPGQPEPEAPAARGSLPAPSPGTRSLRGSPSREEPSVPAPSMETRRGGEAPASLLEAADRATAARDYGRAAALLEQLAVTAPFDHRTPLALFQLGRLQHRRLGQPADAVRSYTRALESDPPDELVIPLWNALEEAKAELPADAPVEELPEGVEVEVEPVDGSAEPSSRGAP